MMHEELGKKQMNPAHIKSVEEVVADLRAKGELDEGAFSRFKKEKLKFKAIYLVLFLIAIPLVFSLNFTSLTIVILIAIAIYFYLFLPSKNIANMLLNLFSYGEITDGIVTSYVQKQVARTPPYFVIYVSYTAYNKKSYKNVKAITGSITYSLYSDIVKLKAGDKVKIIYSKNAPEECWIYTEKLNNTYNIKKK